LLQGGDSGVLSLNPSQGTFMLRDHRLHGSQPGLSASQRRLSLGKAGSAPAEHHFRRRHKTGGLAGNLPDGSQRLAGEATDLTLLPSQEVIAGEKGQYAHRCPVQCFFRTHIAAPLITHFV
jgi:hypothetical protein